jgi:hypothetical protein
MRVFEQRIKNTLTDQTDSSLLRTVEDLRWRVSSGSGFSCPPRVVAIVNRRTIDQPV